LTNSTQSEILRVVQLDDQSFARPGESPQRRMAPGADAIKPMTDSESSSDRERLLDLLHGYRATCLIVAALELGLLDELHAAPVNEELLAARLGAHRPSLRRFLRALEVIGLAEHQAAGVALTALGRLLLDAGAGVRERAILVGQEYMPAWQELRHAVLTGETAFEHVFGVNAWEHRKRRPELNECLNRTMADDQLRSGRSIPAAYDFSASGLIVDVGGGEGALLAEILAQYPQPTGLAFDQHHVAAGASRVLAAARVQNRCRVVGGSFFESVPAGGDTYILQHVLHNWTDERCEAILRTCRAAMNAGSVLLVVENIMPEDAEPTEHLVMLDLHMMVMLGGRERTRSEYRSLLRSAGFDLVRSVNTLAKTEILVATPMP
jgi:hypothetical protein